MACFCEVWSPKKLICPSFRQQLWEEQVSHFRTSDGTLREIEYEDIRDLPVLDSVIRETLRVHPPIHTILVS
jgi:sterol 14-demethylase